MQAHSFAIARLIQTRMKHIWQNWSKIWQNKYTYIVLFLVSPLLVYWDVIFWGYTISNNEIAANTNQRLGRFLPVLDPVAGSLQDHPWLAKIGHSLRQFQLPLINLDNGLGAPLLESLQSGVLYPLNVLLPWMDLSSSQFFDLFSVLHVLILLVTGFVLFKLYLRWELALILALAFAFSWSTFFVVNMVHYRSFVWAPLITWGAVKCARQQTSVRVTLITIAAIFCSITAGNPQESFFDLIVAGIFFVAEVIVSGRFSWRSSVVFLLAFTAGILIASPSVLPYVISRKADLLVSVESSERSAIFISFPWLLGWVIQYINGPFPRWYRGTAMSGDDYAVFAAHPLFFYLAIAGCFILLLERKANSRKQILFLIFLGCAFLSVINTSIFSPFRDFLTQVPFVNTLRFPKYIHHIHLLLGASAAIALSLLMAATPKNRRLAAALGLLTTIAIVLAILRFSWTDPVWRFNYRRYDQLLMLWGGSCLAIGACFGFLVWPGRSLRWQGFFGVIILVSLLIRPYGFAKAFPQHLPFPVSGLDLAQERMLSMADYANSNLLRQYEQLGVFDPILRKDFTLFLGENFPLIMGFLHPQVSGDVILNAQQIDVLRLMGVTSIAKHNAEVNPHLTQISPDFIKVNDPLPKVFVVKSPEAINQLCDQRNYSEALKAIAANTISTPTQFRKGVNDVSFQLDRPAQGTLVSLQAFSTGWQWNSTPATRFCRTFNTWSGNFEAGKSYTLSYVPPGLRLSYGVALVGILLMLAAVWLSRQTGITPAVSPFEEE
jgi:hypothetical protein